MIRLGLRMSVAGGREAIVRLVTIAAAVALGAGLLLATVAGINAVNSQNARYAWLNTGTAPAAGQPAPAAAGAPEWWLVRGDYFDGQTIGRVSVAATGPDSPVPPGIPRLPGPGEFYASPALADLLASTPAPQLADRFPGHQIGTIGDAALPAPNSLIIVIGYPPDELSQMPGAKQVTSIGTVTPSDCDGCFVGIRRTGMDLVLSVVAAALLFPVLIFIGAATRLTAARREQRFAAMRLIGATPRQISVVAAVESTVAAVAGTVVGFGVFLLLRNPLAAIPFTGAPFYPADLSLNVLDVLLVGLGIPAGAALTARLALRRVRISPLGVSRRTTPRPPRWYRVIPLLLGVGMLAYFFLAWNRELRHDLQTLGIGRLLPMVRRPETGLGQVEAFLPAFLIIMAGLVIAGPWLTMVGARVLARRSGRPAALIALRRLADNPQASFRAISGVVLGLFVTTVATGVMASIAAHQGGGVDNPLGATAMSVQFWSRDPQAPGASSVPDTLTADLRSTPGVRSVTVVRRNPADDRQPGVLPGLALCADLARDSALGHCADGATIEQVYPDLLGPPPRPDLPGLEPVDSVSAEQFQRLPVLAIVANTDGSTAALERTRTLLGLAYPNQVQPAATDKDFRTDSNKVSTGWQQLANVVVLASLPIAGSSLAVSVAGGLSERKRPFSLLRLSGVPLRVLRRVVVLESAVPLLAVAAISIGTGLLAADLFLRAQMEDSLRRPGGGFYLVVGAGLVASLAIIASTLPLLERITGPETARND